MKRKEIYRQTVHILYGLLIAGLVFYLERIEASILLLVILVIGFLLSQINKSKKNIPVITDLLCLCEREYHLLVSPGLGPLQSTIGSLFVVVLFDTRIAFISVLTLTFGDSLSALTGFYFGRHLLPWSGHKTVEGTMACFLASFLVCVLFVPYAIAVILGLTAALIESLAVRFDDNVLIPLAVGCVLWLLGF